jgi:coproporphyrinogen III oxidase-like Fe-S oxidoreductase
MKFDEIDISYVKTLLENIDINPQKKSWVSIYPPFRNEDQCSPNIMFNNWKSNPREKIAFLYYHIPFCETKCKYCIFFTSNDTNLVSRYIDSLIIESNLYLSHLTNKASINHLYFGGGTPNSISINQLDCVANSILNHVPLSKIKLRTLEGHPAFLNNDYFLFLKNGFLLLISLQISNSI